MRPKLIFARLRQHPPDEPIEHSQHACAAIAIVVSIDKPEVDPERHIAVLNGSREEIFRVPVYSKPSMSST
jgi:hypothetical protein